MTTVREIGKPSEEKLKILAEAGLSDETVSVLIEIIKALVVYDK